MTWERGFVICQDDVADAIGSQLQTQTVSIRLVSRLGETAFAFAGRAIPTFDLKSHLVCSVDGRNSGYSHSSLKTFRPTHLVPKLGLTFGITLGKTVASRRHESPDLVVPWSALGPESEVGVADDLAAFRWDLDHCEVGDPQLRSHTESLRAIHRSLEERRIPHRIVLFDDGWPDILGELAEAGDVFTGPSTCLTLDWQSQDGDSNTVTANDAEFIADGDEIPDSQRWAL